MDPTITKATTDKERLVTSSAESQPTSCDPNRTRFLEVQVVIHVKMLCDKNTLLTEEDTSLPWDIDLIIDDPVDEPKRNPKVKC
jgi:hypothetical protein